MIVRSWRLTRTLLPTRRQWPADAIDASSFDNAMAPWMLACTFEFVLLAGCLVAPAVVSSCYHARYRLAILTDIALILTSACWAYSSRRATLLLPLLRRLLHVVPTRAGCGLRCIQSGPAWASVCTARLSKVELLVCLVDSFVLACQVVPNCLAIFPCFAGVGIGPSRGVLSRDLLSMLVFGATKLVCER